GDPYRAFLNWIDEIQRLIGERRWLLLTIDEFSRIDGAIRSGRMDERIFSTLRTLIEQYPQVAVALCGNFTLAESHPLWREALKSAQTIPVNYLDRDAARRVLTKPALDFPDGVYSEAAIDQVLESTNGQPYLLQLIGDRVVNQYNRSREQLPDDAPSGLPISVEVIVAAESQALAAGDNALASIWQWALRIGSDQDLVAPFLRGIARGEPLESLGDSETRAELLDLFCERDLLTQDAKGMIYFRVPMLARWISIQRRLPRI
ncbi:MAG: hypothetical protein WAU48_10680, partial [Gammaproteobacteria bacterium]